MRSDTALAALAGVALGDSVPVALRQLGVIRRLPDPPWRGFDSNQVTTSPEAFPLGVPDALPAIALYLTELGLVALRRRRESRWLDRALAACVAAGALAGSYYLYEMIAVEKKACAWCIVAQAAGWAMVPLAWRLVRRRR